jgi:hypothetical protein
VQQQALRTKSSAQLPRVRYLSPHLTHTHTHLYLYNQRLRQTTSPTFGVHIQEEMEQSIVVFRSSTREQACESDYTPPFSVFLFLSLFA